MGYFFGFTFLSAARVNQRSEVEILSVFLSNPCRITSFKVKNLNAFAWIKIRYKTQTRILQFIRPAFILGFCNRKQTGIMIWILSFRSGIVKQNEHASEEKNRLPRLNVRRVYALTATLNPHDVRVTGSHKAGDFMIAQVFLLLDYP